MFYNGRGLMLEGLRQQGDMAYDKKRLKGIFHEVFHNKPSTVKHASREKMHKQMVAISLSKARRAGVKT